MTSLTTAAPLLGEPLPVELMNTIWADRDGLHDALGEPAESSAWLRSAIERDDVAGTGLATWLEAADQKDLASVHQKLRALRDSARCLAARQTGDARDRALTSVSLASAIATVNALAASAPAWPVLDWPDHGEPQAHRESTSGPGLVFVADVAQATVALLADESGHHVRACQAPGCVLYFVKQHPRREWCSEGCGNRARQARHYRRHHRDD